MTVNLDDENVFHTQLYSIIFSCHKGSYASERQKFNQKSEMKLKLRADYRTIESFFEYFISLFYHPSIVLSVGKCFFRFSFLVSVKLKEDRLYIYKYLCLFLYNFVFS